MDTAANPLDAEFDNLVYDIIASWHVPGISIAVVSGEQVFAKVRNTITVSNVL